jgi:glycogen phosphorylase
MLDALRDDRFCPDEPGLFRWIYDTLLDHDAYFVLADFASFLDSRERTVADYLNRPLWLEKAVINVARMGRFSSDRTIAQYARDIWGIVPAQPPSPA